MEIEVNIDIKGHLSRVQSQKLWLFAATEWHRLYSPYVPMQTGVMKNTVNITANGGSGTIEHTVPYAHYIYEGEIYGPNYPKRENGVIVSWSSPPKKHPTGRMMQYHGLGSRHWDEAAAPAKLPILVREIQAYVDSGALGFGGK